MRRFSKGEAIRFGWDKVTNRVGLFIALSLVVFFLPSLPGLFIGEDANVVFQLFSFFYSWIVGLILALGFIGIALKTHDGQEPEFSDIFAKYYLFFRFLVASILVGLATFFGVLLLIIPGVYIALRLQFFGYLMVDEDLGVVEAIKKSWAITEGSAWQIFLFGLLVALVQLAGVLALLVGTLVTYPLTIVATAFVYRKLLTAPQQ